MNAGRTQYVQSSSCLITIVVMTLFSYCCSYRYELCPFANVTQHEEMLRWNTYHGVLGYGDFLLLLHFVDLFLPIDEAIASRAVTVIVSRAGGNAFGAS